ncbi:MAG: long-chain fatty acid--CoA ligase [Halieaceae bacterium]|jgi:acyl-CoA synthetase (AMP-forming)/AMP-acid ligase II|nr:long-chain fatty acid--CoA ligase [Halieaceae bacterium]
MKTNIGEVLSRRAFHNPDKEACVNSQSGLRLTFSQLNERSNRCANMLLANGVKKGDKVALLLMNGAEFIESYFATAKIGAVVVPLNWRLVADELTFILRDCGAQTVIFGGQFRDLATQLVEKGDEIGVQSWIEVCDDSSAAFAKNYAKEQVLSSSEEPSVDSGDDDLLFIMYTSGTTGLPKGVLHSHRTAMAAMLTISATVDARQDDIYLLALPLFHVGALTPMCLNIYLGTTAIIMPEFNPVRAWEIIEQEKISTGLLVPAMLNFMIQVPQRGDYDHSTVRWVHSGASPLPVSCIRQYADIGIEVHQIYGLTETGGPTCVISAEHALEKAGSTGRAFFHTDVKIVDSEGLECPSGEAGEVCVRGNHIMVGYLNRPEATAEALVDGWLQTGDVATMDEQGFVYIQDRIKDMIISGGENVYPAEIENVILSHPGVADVAVIGRESERWGESPFAVVVRSSETLTEADVLAHCDGKLARFKLPKGAAFVEVIPRNPSGKILKRVLREEFSAPL